MCNKLIVRDFFVLSSRLQRYDIYARWLLQSYKKIVRLEKFSVYFTILLYFLSCFLLLHKKNSSLGSLFHERNAACISYTFSEKQPLKVCFF